MERHPIDAATAAVLERLDREEQRAETTTRSHLIGGISEAGAKIDDLLRAVLEEVAKLAAKTPGDFLPTINDRPVSLRKTTAGQLLGAIRKAAHGIALPPTVRTLVEDVRKRPSVLSGFVDIRNAAVHEAVVSVDARKCLGRLRGLLEDHRREAGWDE